MGAASKVVRKDDRLDLGFLKILTSGDAKKAGDEQLAFRLSE